MLEPRRHPGLISRLCFGAGVAALQVAVSVIVLAYLGGQHAYAQQPAVESSDTGEHSGRRIVDPVIVKGLKSGNAVEVIVQLRIFPEFKSEAGLPPERAKQQRAAIADSQRKLIRHLAVKLPKLDVERIRTFKAAPFVALTINAEIAAALGRYPDALDITRDLESRPMSERELEVIGVLPVQRALSSMRYPSLDGRGPNSAIGRGQTIAVIDTGIDASHPMLQSAVVEEACFSSSARSCVFLLLGCRDTHRTHCPSGNNRQTGPGSARHCTYNEKCNHGTGISGIAAGRAIEFEESDGSDSTITRKIAGVAPGARLISINAFRRKLPDEVVALQSDIAAALEHVLALSDDHDIAAVLLATGLDNNGEAHAEACDRRFRLLGELVTNLKSRGIATIVPYQTGRTGSNELGVLPYGCLSDVVRVGEPGFVAPGSTFTGPKPHVMTVDSMRSSSPNAATAEFEGLSVAAAFVAGSWAILKAIRPGASVEDIVSAIQRAHQQVPVTRADREPRLRLDRTAGELMSNPAFLRPSDLYFEINPVTSSIFEHYCKFPVYFDTNAAFNRSNRYIMEAQNLTTGSGFDTLVDRIGESRSHTSFPFALFNFRSGHRYRLTARVCTQSGARCSPSSVPFDFAMPEELPRPPVDFRVASVGHRQITVAWSPFQHADNWPRTESFFLHLDGSGARRTLRLGKEARSFVFSNLRPNATYRIRITSCGPYCSNQLRCHPDYRHLHASTLAYTVPDAPGHLRVCFPTVRPFPASPADTIVSPRTRPCEGPGRHFMWTDNSGDEAYFRFEYRAQAPAPGNRRPPFNPVSWSHARVPANWRSFTLPSLSAGLYQLRVKACNHINGCSNPSNTLTITVN